MNWARVRTLNSSLNTKSQLTPHEQWRFTTQPNACYSAPNKARQAVTIFITLTTTFWIVFSMWHACLTSFRNCKQLSLSREKWAAHDLLNLPNIPHSDYARPKACALTFRPNTCDTQRCELKHTETDTDLTEDADWTDTTIPRQPVMLRVVWK